MKLNKHLLSIYLLILVFVVTACSKSNQPASTGTESSTASSQGATELSNVNMLLVGTLKLEDTDQAVSAEEADTLLPLWQAYRSLSSSQTAAEAEVDALLKQIESTMTTAQMEAIRAMNLTNTDLMDLMQSMGVGTMLRGTPDPNATPDFQFGDGTFGEGGPQFDTSDGPPAGFNGGNSGRGSGGAQGGMPGGGFVIQVGPGGDAGSDAGLGGGQMLQGTPDPSMQATAQARFGTQANQVNSMLLNVLISKLEAKNSN